MTPGPELVRTALGARRHPAASPAELRAYQDRALRRLVRHAYERVPFYRALFDRHRLHPRHIRGVRDLELIPFTSKADMRPRPERERIAAGHEPEALLRVRTSGSSGEPFTIRRTWLEDKVQYLFRIRAFDAMQVGPRDHVVVVGVARPGDGGSKLIGRVLRALGWFPRTKLDGFQDPDVVLRRLGEVRPDVMVGYPGMLDRLTAPELAPLRAAVRPRLILTGGEVLIPAIRARLGQAFGARVIETYASNECPLIAWSCPHGDDLHSCDDAAIVEVLREGRPAAPGERGEVVLTNLHAYAMPFIRYRLGDLATRGAPCACGQPFSTLGAVQGRMLDYFPLPSGRLMHPYEIVHAVVWGSADWIRHYELVQERTDRIVLRVVASAPPSPSLLEELVRAAERRLEPGVTFTIEMVDRIPFSPTGKFRPSRSLVRSEYAALASAGAGSANV